MTLWKIACQEDVYPGMGQRWYKNQCVAVGWAAAWGYELKSARTNNRGWSTARNALLEMQAGDPVIVSLRGNRIGRIGEITGKEVEDHEWNPLVPPGIGLEDGEMGRRVFVRWDLTVGPDSPDLVVQLPPGSTFSRAELRPTISRIKSMDMKDVVALMNDESNWVRLLGKFRYEKALSDYIANYPNHLEDGLLPHPNSKIRERVFLDKSRSDVMLIDRLGHPVIVECKQHSPSVQDIHQLRHYMILFEDKTGESARGILVHGGAPKLILPVVEEASGPLLVEIVSYALKVAFTPSRTLRY